MDWPDISPMLQGLLSARGISSEAEAHAFLHPSLSDMSDPFLLPNMHAAVQRILDALEDGESICVYGDYDVDGVTATAILVDYFRRQNARVDFYIPSRHGEGYGLNVEAVREIAQKSNLLITVDCGVTAVEEARIASQLGLDLIVTDHHQVSGELPACCAVVDPVLGEGHAPYCGAGVALKLVQALGGEQAMMDALDFAAMGTVADIVPLRGENRIITKFGLEKLRKNGRIGIQALCWIAGVEPSEMQSSHISYLLAPRINAGGRLGHSGRCVELLLSDDLAHAKEIAQELDDENTERRRVEQEIFQEADRIASQVNFLEDRIIIASGDWNPGVIGLAASKLVEKYHWPVILLSHQGEFMVGSGRSIKGLNLHAALLSISDIFERFGGHEQAAGLTLRTERYDEFCERLQETLRSFPKDNYIEIENYDLPLKITDIDDALIEEMEKLQPFGYGNHAPYFMIERVSLVNAQRVGHMKSHLKMRLSDGKNLIDAIAFKMGDKVRNLSGLFDIIGTPSENIWNGSRSLQCEIRAMKPSLDTGRFLANSRQHIEENLRIHFARCLFTGRQGDVEILSDPERIDGFLREAAADVQGTLFFAKTPDTLAETLRLLGDDLRADRVQLGDNPVLDARAFNALLYAGKTTIGREPIETYRNVVLLDGDWADAAGLQAQFPAARMLALHTGETAECALPYLERMCIPVDEMRALYVALKQDSAFHARIGDTKALFRRYMPAAQNDPLRLLAGLAVFAELGLLRADMDNGAISLLPSHKCDIRDSAIYRRIEERKAEFSAIVGSNAG